MHSTMKSYIRSFAQISLLYATALASPTGKTDHCTALEPCWPSAEEFESLNSSLSGNLVETFPAAWFCHDPNFDEAQCAEAQTNWLNSTWRAIQPGAYQDTLWEGNCTIDSPRQASCNRGRVPYITAEVASKEDVQEAVKFAKDHRLRLRVKGNSHDYVGRSSGEGSFSISTALLKGVEVKDSLNLERCDSVISEPVIIVSAGEGFANVYRVGAESDRVVVGGTSKTVGASGGWILGGGHSALSPLYGLGADNALQFEVVTADGEYKVVNNCSEPDLFWALRGGGGGFAVLLSTTYRTYPMIPALGVGISISTPDQETFTEIIQKYLALQPEMADKGFTGYSYILQGEAAAGKFNLSTVLTIPDPKIDIETANATFKPLYDMADKDIVTEFLGAPIPRFSDIYQATEAGAGEGGTPAILGSRLISRDAFSDESTTQELAELFCKSGPVILMHLVAGGRVNEIDPDSAAASPGWRKALQHIVVTGQNLQPGNDTAVKAAREQAVNLAARMGEITGSDSSYTNEDSPDAPNHKELWWGSHLDRLNKIKKQYDPNGVLTCQACIGDENGY